MVEKSPLRELARKRGRKTRPGSAREFVRRVGLGAPSLEYRWALWVALTITSAAVRGKALLGGAFSTPNGLNSFPRTDWRVLIFSPGNRCLRPLGAP